MVIKSRRQSNRNYAKYFYIINFRIIFNESHSVPVISMFNFVRKKSSVCNSRNTQVDFNHKNTYADEKRAQENSR